MEESRLAAFENGVLMRLFRPKRTEMTEDWRKLHDEFVFFAEYW
jgi:hypothetical protein